MIERLSKCRPAGSAVPSPAAPARRATRRAITRRLVAMLLCCASLAGTACDSSPDNDATRQPPARIAPSDVFSRPMPKRTIPTTRQLLVVGDSLSISLGEQLERALSGAAGIDFARDGMRSTGLTRPELLDWPARLRERVSRTAPDVVVIMLGANDVMPVAGPDGGRVYFDSPAWSGAYAAKARKLVTLCRDANPRAAVYWVGIPPMGEASLAAGARQVNAALAAMCAATPGCCFIDTQAAFSDTLGRFTRHGRDAATGETLPLRTADGVHMTDSGAKLLAGVVLGTLADREKLPLIAGVDELRTFARDLRPVADEAPKPAGDPPTGVKTGGKSPVRAGARTYVVKKGDTLRLIAKRLDIDADDLAAVNPDIDSRRLSIGQTLRLPARR